MEDTSEHWNTPLSVHTHHVIYYLINALRAKNMKAKHISALLLYTHIHTNTGSIRLRGPNFTRDWEKCVPIFVFFKKHK